MTLNNLDEIDFPLLMSYDTNEGKVKYVRDIMRQNLQNHINQLSSHLVLGKDGMRCPIFDRKDICTDCTNLHWLEQYIGVEEDTTIGMSKGVDE